VVTAAALWLGLRSKPLTYEAKVKLQITTPQREDVAVYDEYRYGSVRDEITVARNNLLEVLQGEQARNQTVSRLGLEEDDAKYDLDVDLVRDADFVNVTVGARSSELAAWIANAHVDTAIAYYGELRAKPTDAERSLFALQLRAAREELREAEDALANFRTENGVASLDTELATYQQLLRELQLERDQRMLEENTAEVDELIAQRQSRLRELMTLAPRYRLLEENAQQAREQYRQLLSEFDEASAEENAGAGERLRAAEEAFLAAEEAFAEFQADNSISSLENEFAIYRASLEELQSERDRRTLYEPDTGPVAEVDELIADRQEELGRLVALAPTYNLLQDNAQKARENYQRLLDKYAEADLKVNVAKAASFIQIVEPAQPPTQPLPGWPTVALAVAGSLGLGVLSAFLLDYVSTSEETAKAGWRASRPAWPTAGVGSLFRRLREIDIGPVYGWLQATAGHLVDYLKRIGLGILSSVETAKAAIWRVQRPAWLETPVEQASSPQTAGDVKGLSGRQDQPLGTSPTECPPEDSENAHVGQRA
jgi:uncharacterized protein involved in exopolysaccharide biosynthesis